jgi:hypothetical protein
LQSFEAEDFGQFLQQSHQTARLQQAQQKAHDRRLHDAGEQLFHAFFAQSFTQAPQLCGVARPSLLKILVVSKLLPSRCLAQELNHVLIALVERMLEVQQRHHQTGGQTKLASIGDAANSNGRDRAKLIQVIDLLASLDRTRPPLRKGCLYFLPRHAIGQHRQWVVQIDHLIQAVAEKVIDRGAAF